MGQAIRHRRRKRTHEEPYLDLTAMIDIITILLFFLLMHYDATSVTFNVPKGVALPYSATRGNEVLGINVQVSPVSIWVKENLVVADYVNDKTTPIFDEDKKLVLPLYNELVKERRVIEDASRALGKTETFSGKVNLMVDKTIPYEFLKKIMFTCAEAGYKKYQFIVLNREI
jgi:biopolymer transport protein ExbD